MARAHISPTHLTLTSDFYCSNRLRNSTYQRLLLLDKDEYKLGDVMRESLSLDPIAPVLYEPHYDALNRRLGIVIKEVKRCIEHSESESDVLKAEPTLAEYLRSIKPHND